MEEQWKAIVIEKNGKLFDFTGKYEVSNTGKIRSLNYKHIGKIQILKLSKNNRGYLVINLYKDGKKETFKVHRLVASCFLENKDNLPEVNHKDKNKENNNVSNLEWCDRTYNVQYSLNRKIICVENNKIFDSIKEAYAWLGIEYTGNIGDCCNGRQKTAYGYHWKYIEEEKELD